MVVILLFAFCSIIQAEEKYFIMTSTGYSNHPNCISDKWRDGKTAMNTPIREGVVAINVDKINGEWQVRSPLRLGQTIHIEGIGEFAVEDTGSFTEDNYKHMKQFDINWSKMERRLIDKKIENIYESLGWDKPQDVRNKIDESLFV